MSAIDQAEFDEVSHRVLRNFLRSMRWKTCQYLVVPVAASPEAANTADASGSVVEQCRAIAARAGDSVTSKEFAEPLLRRAMRLDQWCASPEALQAALPHALLHGNAVACLMLARAMLRAGRHDEALGFLLEGAAINPRIGAVRQELGLALMREGRISEAAGHLEASLDLYSGLRFDHPSLEVPVAVFSAGNSVEIHMYRGRFYVYKRDADFVRALPFDGVLFEIRRNALYRLVRRVVRLLMLRPLMLKVISRVVAARQAAISGDASQDPAAPATARFWRRLPSFIWRALARKLALHMFARPIPPLDSMAEAMALARSLARDSRE